MRYLTNGYFIQTSNGYFIEGVNLSTGRLKTSKTAKSYFGSYSVTCEMIHFYSSFKNLLESEKVILANSKILHKEGDKVCQMLAF